MRAAEFTDTLLMRGRIAVCVGCGGVGKTTVAAALALEAARRGRRALVLTIDPARRLADALGVEALGNQPQPLERNALRALGVREPGQLSAMMLDMKRTFDDLVERFAESSEARERILSNPIYQHASEALAGSVEYSAMEKVYEMWQRDEYDLIVVDTPPAQHALDFLEAPQRLIEFLESRIVQMLIHPAFAAGRFGFRLFQQATRRVLHVLERVSGIAFLRGHLGVPAGLRGHVGRVPPARDARADAAAGARGRLRPGDGTGRGVGAAGDAVSRATGDLRGAAGAASWSTGCASGPAASRPPCSRRAPRPSADLTALAGALADACGSEIPAAEAAQAALERREGIRCAGAARRPRDPDAARARGGG